MSWALSHMEHNGVCWFSAHPSSGILSCAKQESLNLQVFKPQSTQGLVSNSNEPTASAWSVAMA